MNSRAAACSCVRSGSGSAIREIKPLNGPTSDRPEHLKKAGLTGGHSVCVNNEPIVLNNRHQTVKQGICLAVFIMCGKIAAHFRGKERKGTKKPPPRVGEEVI